MFSRRRSRRCRSLERKPRRRSSVQVRFADAESVSATKLEISRPLQVRRLKSYSGDGSDFMETLEILKLREDGMAHIGGGLEDRGRAAPMAEGRSSSPSTTTGAGTKETKNNQENKLGKEKGSDNNKGQRNKSRRFSKSLVQRVSQYDKVLHNLLETSSNQSSKHPRDQESLLDPERTVREMVKEREEEMSQAENESRLLQIQERFPHDELNLFGGAKEMTKAQKFKALSTRRRSAPSTVIRTALSTSSKLKTIQDKSNNNESPPGSMLALDLGPLSSSLNLPSMGGGRDHPSPTSDTPTSPSPSCRRLYIMEGPVQLSVGLQVQSRYLILMNDTLIIAKPKSSTSFRLKQRLRVGELWLHTCLEEVSEVARTHDCSFVLGWPTNNVALTFASTQERELWWHSLSKHIELKRKEDEGKSVNVRVLNRDTEYSAFPSKTLQVSSEQRSSDLLDMAMREFSMPEEARSDYQLWVQSGREDSLCPLIGHEFPYAIKMSHIRDAQDKPSDALVTSEMDHLSSADNELREHQCQFIIRKKGKPTPGISIDTSAIQRKLRKGRKSPFKLSFKRSISNKEGLSPPLTSPMSPHARLFGLPLSMVCPDNSLPRPILSLLTTLYHQAPFVMGVFRKSANARVCRELRDALDAGEQCNLEDVSVHVAASVFKDFLRSLPDSLLVCSQCEDWIATNDIEDREEKLSAIKVLLDQLLDINLVLLRHLFNMLHYVSLHHEENNMTSYNLAICVAPSMLWPPANAPPTTQAVATKKIPSVVEFMIDNAKDVFGDDILSLFGEPPVHRPENRRHDSSGDSDSMNEVSPFIKRDDSSLDSIEKEFFVNDSEQDPSGVSHKWQYGGTPVLSPSTLSRDSGITSSDNQLYPDSDNTDTTDSGMDTKEKVPAVKSTNVRPTKTPPQFANTDDLFWRQRRGSEPSPLSKEAAKNRMAHLIGSGSGNNTADNSPDVSDHEWNLSEDTLKLIKDMNKECSSKLLNAMLPEDMRSSSRRSSGNSLQMSEKGLEGGVQHGNSMPTTPTEEEPSSSIPCLRRQSVPSIGSGSPTFPRRLTSSRRSASSMSSSSSERMSDAQSSSSSERLHSSKLGMKLHRTDIDMAKTLQAASSNMGRVSPHGGPNVGQHGFQPSYKKMFMNSDTRGLPSRPTGLPMRPRTLNPRPTQGTEATPPREFFPKDATTRSSLSHSQSSQGLAPHPEQSDKRPTPVKRNSSPTIPGGQLHTKQRVSKTQSDSSASLSSSSPARVTPPTYQEAMSRRAILQHRSQSMDTASSTPTATTDHSPRRRSGEGSTTKHRHADRSTKSKGHLMAGGIIFLGSDSDSSDEDDDYRSGGYPHGPTKNRGVRRTSSDSVATNRKGSIGTSVQRSSSDTAKPAGNEIRSKQQQRNMENARRSSQPAPRRRHHNGDAPRRTSSGGHPTRRPADPTPSNSDPSLGGTALHFPFPDPRAEPPSSPLSSPRGKQGAGDAKNGYKSMARGAEQAVVTQARRDWQRRKASGKDLKVTVEDLDNINYTDESYV